MNKMITKKTVDAEVISLSREIIKPSRPTPPCLRRYQLSVFDQIAPREYISLVLFYLATDNINDGEVRKLDIVAVSDRLKSSLSEALTRYYPLAGRLYDNLIVECNNQGVPYLETKVGCALSDVLHAMNPEEDSMLRKLLPFVVDDHGSTLLGVQFNVFECGGIALGLCLSHKVADGASSFHFINNWAEICHGVGGENATALPEFIGPKLFPPKDSYNNLSMGVYPSTIFENISAKRFVFGPQAVEALRKKAGANLADNQRKPSRVEAVEAFILNRFAASTDRGGDFVMHQTVDLRRIVDSPVPENAFGNMVGRALAYLHRDNTSTTGGLCNDLVPRFRKAMRDAITMESMEKNVLQLLQLIVQESQGNPNTIPFGFTSICGFRVYGSDFGWGKPSLMDSPTRLIRNFAGLKDTNSQDGGVEALIALDKEDMLNFQKDEEVQFYVRFDDKTCRL